MIKQENVKKKYSGFTLIEMLIVLLVIAVLLMLFVPNIAGKRKAINAKGDEAFKQVIATQVELYMMNETEKLSYEALVEKNYLTQKQVDKANELKIKLNAVKP